MRAEDEAVMSGSRQAGHRIDSSAVMSMSRAACPTWPSLDGPACDPCDHAASQSGQALQQINGNRLERRDREWDARRRKDTAATSQPNHIEEGSYLQSFRPAKAQAQKQPSEKGTETPPRYGRSGVEGDTSRPGSGRLFRRGSQACAG